jgi:tartrate-resistant acid phosphatase type 5
MRVFLDFGIIGSLVVNHLGNLVAGEEAQIKFAAYGDWGGNNSDLRKTVDAVASLLPDRDFLLLTGDNAYPAGFTSVDDRQFSVFTDVVASGVSYPHYMVLGNHDYMGDVNTELLFATKDSRWILPSRYYQKSIVKGDVSICLLVIDTVRFDNDQAAWLSSQLQTPECDTRTSWTVVSGHYPIWSAGMYGDSRTLTETLLPILHTYNVQIYICGHEHLHEVFYDGKVIQIVSGATALTRAAVKFREHPTQVWGVSGLNVAGFIKAVAARDSLQLSVISSNSRKPFVEFAVTRGSTRESQFGHINWSYIDSNRDAAIAEASTEPNKSSSAPFMNLWLLSCIFLLFSFSIS